MFFVLESVKEKVSPLAGSSAVIQMFRSVATVDIDQFFGLIKYTMTKLTASIVVHSADENNLFRSQSVSSVTDKIGLLRQQRFELIFILHKVGDILRLHAEDSRVSLCQNLGLVFTQICRDEVLPNEIFRLHHIAIADDESDRAVQCIQKSVQMRCNTRSI